MLEKDGDPYGTFGTFTSEYTKEQKEAIKDKMGIQPDKNLGIKLYKFSDIDTIQENLAFHYIRPYIAKSTKIKVPYSEAKLSFYSLFLNKLLPVQKINGINLKQCRFDRYDYDYYDINMAINDILRDINVTWRDNHGSNVMIGLETYRRVKGQENELSLEEMYKIMLSDAYIIDFGLMYCRKTTEPGVRLLQLKDRLNGFDESLEPRITGSDFNNQKIKSIVSAINIMLS
jgi:hypothetical protein